MDHCQVMMGVERGVAIRAEIERATGVLCPCKQGIRCPLRPPEEENQVQPTTAAL